jgi:hypothetical protein
MSNTIFDRFSAAERKDLARKILDLPPDEQRELVAQLGGIVEKVSAAEAGLERKKTAIARINAAKADAGGGFAAIALLNGTLKRGGLPPVEQLVDKSSDEIMTLFAKSTMASVDRLACKITLSKLKILP